MPELSLTVNFQIQMLYQNMIVQYLQVVCVWRNNLMTAVEYLLNSQKVSYPRKKLLTPPPLHTKLCMHQPQQTSPPVMDLIKAS